MGTKQILATGCAGILGFTAVALAAPAAGGAVAPAGVGTVALAAPASARAGAVAAAPTVVPAREVEREIRGRGAAGTEWEFNVEKEGKRIDVDLDVESPRVGQKWDVRLYHNGKRVTKVVRTTDSDGEFELDRNRPNKKGKDTLRFKAVSSSGEVLRGKIRI